MLTLTLTDSIEEAVYEEHGSRNAYGGVALRGLSSKERKEQEVDERR